MSTGLIIVLVVVVVALIALFVVMGQRKKVEANREKAGELREDAQQRSLRAEREGAIADEKAARARKEAAVAQERAQAAERERTLAGEQHARARDLDPDVDDDAGGDAGDDDVRVDDTRDTPGRPG
jgi:uncharacterized protein HemX